MESIRILFRRRASKGQKSNTEYYVSVILELLVAWRQAQAIEPTRKLIVHADNAKLHTAKVTLTFFKQNFLKRAPHPLIRQILKTFPNSFESALHQDQLFILMYKLLQRGQTKSLTHKKE
jgi:hypothetical protein